MGRLSFGRDRDDSEGNIQRYICGGISKSAISDVGTPSLSHHLPTAPKVDFNQELLDPVEKSMMVRNGVSLVLTDCKMFNSRRMQSKNYLVLLGQRSHTGHLTMCLHRCCVFHSICIKTFVPLIRLAGRKQ